MSREEAIGIINRENDPNDTKVWEVFPEYREALDMAIQALSQEPKTQMVDKSNFDIEQYKMDLQSAYDCGFEEGKKAEQELCTDAVSRQAVLEKQYRIDDSATLSTRYVVNVDDIEELPSVNPQKSVFEAIKAEIKDYANDQYLEGEYISEYAVLEIIDKHLNRQKSGKWLHKEITDDYRVTGQCSECKERRIIDNFCPNCGADMREEVSENDR